jgi:methylase of polypeptide subunit release factors
MSPTSATAAAEGPFRLEAPLDHEKLRERLIAGGYTPASIEQLKHAIRSTTPLTVAAIDRRLAEPSHKGTLLRLFFLGRAVGEDELADAIAPVPVESLIGAGIIWREEPGRLRATARIECRNDWLIFSDFFDVLSNAPPRPDHVMGLAPSTVVLGALTPRRSVESALDLCTGGGFHAMLATAHAERIVATDINARALNFAAMNARLNGAAGPEFRQGSFFEPVAGEKFELIVANPPFVISPSTQLIFRDGGLGGDAVTERMVKGSAEHLEEGGFAMMLANWMHSTPDDWQSRITQWSQGIGCDAWWLRFDQDDPLSYAVHWLQQSEHGDAANSQRVIEDWLDYFEKIGARVFSSGVVVLRKRSGVTNWVRCDSVPGTTSVKPCGDQVERIFDSESLLQELADESDLLERTFKLHPEHMIDQRMCIRDGSAAVQSIELHVTRGIDFPAVIDGHMLKFLAQLDGTRTLRAAGSAIAADLDVEFDRVVPVCLEITKRLMRSGLISAV